MTTLAALLVLAGALLAFVGSLGLLRLKTFFERVHPPTMGTTLAALRREQELGQEAPRVPDQGPH